MIKTELYYFVTNPNNIPRVVENLHNSIIRGKSFIIITRQKESFTYNIVSNKVITFFSITMPSMMAILKNNYTSIDCLETIRYLFSESPNQLINFEAIEFDNTYDDIIEKLKKYNHEREYKFFEKNRMEFEKDIINKSKIS